ncbi:hypothetical protein NZD89_03035 [Alicyclobacillus fastidiosus]|uniref:Uncharacterized protein n=1 Tax=Alicyclobacillus fastidiosus TaxID=392011 RepID=A0ABY6ZKQ5_9BACL|nr:hypothetical protein [Alicyclobacillus fastidiosus]WAH42485.1 hypothetical protein NZD89_03035 [Alicyclobacillus fastidiosus]
MTDGIDAQLVEPKMRLRRDIGAWMIGSTKETSPHCYDHITKISVWRTATIKANG